MISLSVLTVSVFVALVLGGIGGMVFGRAMDVELKDGRRIIASQQVSIEKLRERVRHGEREIDQLNEVIEECDQAQILMEGTQLMQSQVVAVLERDLLEMGQRLEVLDPEFISPERLNGESTSIH